ncbi:hypothetical protein LJIJOHLM_00237 [Escherichia phage KKP 3954]|nr:hypothetical protein LJIJOHLM_00237 [Escherichia phage KKP 3954]
MVLIGSRALQIHAMDMGKDLYRPCVDLDYLCIQNKSGKNYQKCSLKRSLLNL